MPTGSRHAIAREDVYLYWWSKNKQILILGWRSKPESTNRHVESIGVGDVNDGDVPEFYSIMSKVEVDNDTLDWNCQDYVLEALEELAEECVLDEDDREYKTGMRKAKRDYYGPQ